MDNPPPKSVLDPYYTSGEYLKSASGSLDSAFKVDQLRQLLGTSRSRRYDPPLNRVADVGCGDGSTTLLLHDMLRSFGAQPTLFGYDIHPGVSSLPSTSEVTFISADFLAVSAEVFDLVVLFDVIEHIPDPISYLRAVAQKTRWVALHIPLDDSLMVNFRGLSREYLAVPGHLVVLDAASAVNLVTYAGLSIRDYAYTPGFRSPGSRQSRLQKLLYPFRAGLFPVSPYLLQRTLGGVSLMVLAQTPLGIESGSH